MPYGIQIAYATYGAGAGGSIGNASTPFAASCQGLMSCDYAVDAIKLGGPELGPSKSLEVAYRCGHELATRMLNLPKADPGAEVHLDCTKPLPPVASAIASVSGTYGGACGAAAGNADYVLATRCEGKAQCTVPLQGAGLETAAPECAKALEARYRCSGSAATESVKIAGNTAVLDCAGP
jgi:hypothetical protein